jgi:hypothetical protein
MRQGVDKWQAAGFLGMSAELIDRVYGHYLPAHLRAQRAPSAIALGKNWLFHWLKSERRLKTFVGQGEVAQ